MHAAFAQFQAYFALWGLLAVFLVLLLENFGLPLPGELALLYAGYHVSTYGAFSLPALILTAALACFAGECVGYFLARAYADRVRRVLRLSTGHRAQLEEYFVRHGPVTILFARFIAGLRVFAGPIAGLYRMPVHPFLVYNVIGAVAWAAAISAAGALLGAHWHALLQLAGRVDLLILAVAVVLMVAAWRRLSRGGLHG